MMVSQSMYLHLPARFSAHIAQFLSIFFQLFCNWRVASIYEIDGKQFKQFFHHVPMWDVYLAFFIRKIFIFFRCCTMLLGWKRIFFPQTAKIVLSLSMAVTTIRASNCVDCRPWPSKYWRQIPLLFCNVAWIIALRYAF